MGQHQRLGPHGELIHTPELTNYEKVWGVTLALSARYCQVAEQPSLE